MVESRWSINRQHVTYRLASSNHHSRHSL